LGKDEAVSSQVRKSRKGETLTRFVKLTTDERQAQAAKRTKSAHGPKPAQTWLPNLRHKALENSHSIFTAKGVHPVDTLKHILVSGHNNVKIGRDVRKGKLFRDYWIYTVTLEERATCPKTCHHWQDCYGNNMPFAKRADHRDFQALTEAIERDIINQLSVRGRVGILIRLHALGDFFSVEYVQFWGSMLAKYSNLACYGYTARGLGDPIGAAIDQVKRTYGKRFAVRWSDGGAPIDCTVSVRYGDPRPANSFMCPEQSGATVACATCGLCWSTDKNVAFVGH
jgi:hypothetical protein